MKSFTERLDRRVLDIEDKHRSNLFTWRGQFSPQLIESLLDAYCPENATVFDPFAGSGTVLYEAGKKGLEAFACEINPAAWAFSKTYELINVPRAEREIILEELSALIEEEFSFDLFENSPLTYEEIERRMDRIGSLVEDKEKTILNTLVISLDLYNFTHTGESIQNRFIDLSRLIRSLPISERPIKTFLSDCRNSPLEDGSIGFIVTSPPYINVFNYHQNYRKSAESLGWDLLKVARSEIGSNRANRGNRFLTVIQYCLDMALALAECVRLLKRNGRAIFIVGYESSVLGVPFYNSKIVTDLIKGLSGASVVLKQQRSFNNKFGRRIREDLIHFERNNFQDENLAGIVPIARNVAREALSSGLNRVEAKNRHLLLAAIDSVDSTSPTKLFNNNYSEYHTKDFVMMVKEAFNDEYAGVSKTS